MAHARHSLGNERGAALMLALVVVITVSVLGMAMLTSNYLHSTVASNSIEMAKSFHAADGLMTQLAQEVISNRGDRYAWGIEFEGESLHSSAANQPGGDTVVQDTLWIWGGGKMGIYNRKTDHCHFRYVPVSGDFDVSVRVVDIVDSVGSSANKLAGIMVREDLSQGARRVFWGIGDEHGHTFGYRCTRREPSQSDSAHKWNGVSLGHGIRLQRTRHQFSIYLNQGIGWKRLEAFQNEMPRDVYLGVAITPKKDGCAAKACLTDLCGLPAVDTIDLGDYPVRYSINKRWDGGFEITCMAFKLRNGETAFTSTLNQLAAPTIGATYRPYVQDTMYVPVTYYDYHADGSCPDFQRSGLKSVYLKNMVLDDSLDSDRKPISSYASPWTNTDFRDCLLWGNGCIGGDPMNWLGGWGWNNRCYYAGTSSDFPAGGCEGKVSLSDRNWFFSDSIGSWFRPFGAPHARFDTLTGRWSGLEYDDARQAWYGPQTQSRRSAGDTAMINMVIYDSLCWIRDTTINPNDKNTFVYGLDCDPDNYTFCNTEVTPWGDTKNWPEFFHPLKGRGFGYDGPWNGAAGTWKGYPYSSWGVFQEQNFSFALEVHRKFVADTGQIFTFRGNDDLWVFINDSLVMDNGGIHVAVTDTVEIDDLIGAGLVERGQEYWFDLFYCERNGWGSEIFMSTNMMWFDAGRAAQRRWKRDYGSTS